MHLLVAQITKHKTFEIIVITIQGNSANSLHNLKNCDVAFDFQTCTAAYCKQRLRIIPHYLNVCNIICCT